MNKEFAIKALERIKQINYKTHQLHKLGVNLIELDMGVDLLEESIATMFSENDEQFETKLGYIQWWLYGNTSKIVYDVSDNNKEIDISKTEDFVQYLIDLKL